MKPYKITITASFYGCAENEEMAISSLDDHLLDTPIEYLPIAYKVEQISERTHRKLSGAFIDDLEKKHREAIEQLKIAKKEKRNISIDFWKNQTCNYERGLMKFRGIYNEGEEN